MSNFLKSLFHKSDRKQQTNLSGYPYRHISPDTHQNMTMPQGQGNVMQLPTGFSRDPHFEQMSWIRR